MGAEEKLVSLEYDLFCQVRDEIAAQVLRIQKTAKAIAAVDVFCIAVRCGHPAATM